MTIHASDWDIDNRNISRSFTNGRRFGADIVVFRTHRDSFDSDWTYQVDRTYLDTCEYLPELEGTEPTMLEAMATAERLAREFIGAPAEVVYTHAL